MRRGFERELAPLDRLAEAVARATTLSRSPPCRARTAGCGPRRDHRRGGAHGVRFADTTQRGAGSCSIGRFDYLVCAAYKWLLLPAWHGVLHAASTGADGLLPHAAGWYAGDALGTYYGKAAVRPGRAALRPLAGVAVLGRRGARGGAARLRRGRRIGRHDVGMASRLRDGLVPPAVGDVSPAGYFPVPRTAPRGGRWRRAAAARCSLLPPVHDGRRRRPGAAALRSVASRGGAQRAHGRRSCNPGLLVGHAELHHAPRGDVAGIGDPRRRRRGRAPRTPARCRRRPARSRAPGPTASGAPPSRPRSPRRRRPSRAGGCPATSAPLPRSSHAYQP